jgi:hypothetical protein
MGCPEKVFETAYAIPMVSARHGHRRQLSGFPRRVGAGTKATSHDDLAGNGGGDPDL